MGEKSEKLEKGKNEIKDNILRYGVFLAIGMIIIIGIFGPSIIEIFFSWGESGCPTISNKFEASEILDYFGTVFTFIGTIPLEHHHFLV